MSTVMILAPIIISNWPVIAAAVAGAAASLQMSVAEAARQELAAGQVDQTNAVEVELADSEIIAQNIAAGKEIVLTRDKLVIRVKRDQRGRCVVCAEGKGYTKAQLEQTAREFTQKMTQHYVYNKVVTEIKANNMKVVNQEVLEDQSVRIQVRHWVD